MSAKRSVEFRFRKTDNIGAASAEDDSEYLKDCFVETDDYEVLRDRSDIRQIVLGRTGSGKSALFERLKQDDPDRAITIEPHRLSLNHVSSSTEIRFFADLGVNMDPFYKLLWRHVLTVEILRKHFEPTLAQGATRIWERLSDAFKVPSPRTERAKKCIEYLEVWGRSFWLETEYRVREITQKFERDLRGQTDVSIKPPRTSLGVSRGVTTSASEERTIEVVNRAQKVVSDTQISELNAVTDVLEGVLTDRQKFYYVMIDRLDEDWAEDALRYRLIMALIDSAKEISRVPNIKILISIRRDLIERVFRLISQTGIGFQEEKYQSLYLPMRWSRSKIIDILDRRISKLVERRYERQRTVKHSDLLPKRIDKNNIAEYITDRAPRPRDVIMLCNKWIEGSEGKPRLSVSTLRRAEGEYSRQRLRALGDEWHADYPELGEFLDVLKERPVSFGIASVEDTLISELCLNFVVKQRRVIGELGLHAARVVERATLREVAEFKRTLFTAFYKMGLVGLKLESFESVSWVDELGQGISDNEVDETTRVIVHPTYRRALGIRAR